MCTMIQGMVTETKRNNTENANKHKNGLKMVMMKKKRQNIITVLQLGT